MQGEWWEWTGLSQHQNDLGGYIHKCLWLADYTANTSGHYTESLWLAWLDNRKSNKKLKDLQFHNIYETKPMLVRMEGEDKLFLLCQTGPCCVMCVFWREGFGGLQLGPLRFNTKQDGDIGGVRAGRGRGTFSSCLFSWFWRPAS